MEEKVCKNCKYYLPHYIKQKVRLIQIDGHCTYSDVKRKSGRKMKPHENCEKWECAEQQETANKEVILKTLREMEKHLSEIAIILKENN